MEKGSGLDVLLSRLEAKKQADQIFSKNLEFLKTKSPDLYDRVKNYKPDRLIPAFDNSGSINLQNANGRFVYPESPVAYAVKQVDEFLTKTKSRFIRYDDTAVVKQKDYIHQQMMDSLIELYPEKKKSAHSPQEDSSLQMVILCGIGAGLHIDLLLKSKSIRNLVIYDTDLSGFFASLFFVEWSKILRGVSGAIEVIIENDLIRANDRLAKFFTQYGFYNLSKYYVYYHYENRQIKKFVDNLREKVIKVASGLGFYDDERIGLAHTLQNVDKGYDISRKALHHPDETNLCPVIVIGNGPSLDESIEFIRENREKSILISCGTAIGTLENLGIKPDIHVEQERTRTNYDWINGSTSAEFRKGIRFVGLNTVYPQCFDLFDQELSYICLKPNDLGMVFVKNAMERTGNNTIGVADGCNPTVTNFGLSLAVIMGLKDVYLAGVDCGMERLDKHHAGDSKYHSDQSKSDFAKKSLAKTGVFRIKGTTGELIYTTSVLNNTRIEIERLISKYELSVKNIGSGAYINGAENISAAELSPLPVVTSDLIPELFAEAFYRDDLNFPDAALIRDTVCEEINSINEEIKAVFLQANLSTEQGMYQAMTMLNRELNNFKISDYTRWLVKGSLNYIMVAVSSVYAYSENSSFSVLEPQVKEIVSTFLDAQKQDIAENFYDLGDYSAY